MRFWQAALLRAARTFCQVAVASIGTTTRMGEVDWVLVLSTSALSALLSILTSISTGLPEVGLPPSKGAHELEEHKPDMYE